MTLAWVSHINQFVWGENHPGDPPPPAWLHVSQSTYSFLNLHIASACAVSSICLGLLALPKSVFTGVLIATAGCVSATFMTSLSIIATF